VYDDIKIITFELISAFTTTGYSITAISLLPHLFIFMIITGMLIGGSVASTSGGMKTYRIYTLLAMIPWMFKKIDSPPHAIIPLKINSKVVEENDLFVNIIFITSFLSLFFTGTIIFLLLGYSFLDSSFQIASALGTVGLQTVDLLHVPVIGKIILILGMLIGRLEIFPLAILLKRFWKL
jgi:trk system potassium uptake protein